MSYRFQGQQPNEEVVLFTRKHPFVLVHPFLLSVLILLIPFVVYAFSGSNSLLGLAILICLLLAGYKSWKAWYSWTNSMLLLTDERVVLLIQKGIVHREFSESSLHNIQQVSHEVKGALHTVLGFGNINIMTGNSQAPFEVPDIPDPYDVQQEIQRLISLL